MKFAKPIPEKKAARFERPSSFPGGDRRCAITAKADPPLATVDASLMGGTIDAFEHVGEACGASGRFTPDEAWAAGWDYPPRVGAFGVIAPRTCGDGDAKNTVWWQLVILRVPVEQLEERRLATAERIVREAIPIE